jgi:SAM-dependent methyltransferase
MDDKDKVRAFFTEKAADYSRNESQKAGPDLVLLLDRISPVGDELLLDVATGVGHTAIALAPRVRHVVGVDLTPRMEEEFTRNAAAAGVTNVEFVVGDAESIGYPDGNFHFVTCRRALHHFPDPGKAVAEVARVLRPGGVAAFADMTTPDQPAGADLVNGIEKDRDSSHGRALPPAEWREVVTAAGLAVESVDLLLDRIAWNDWLSPVAPGGEEDAAARETVALASDAAKAEVVEETAGDLRLTKRRIVLVARRPVR